MTDPQHTPNYLGLAADIVSAFVSNNSLPVADLPALIGNVNQALKDVDSGSSRQPVEERNDPAVPIKKSVQPDFIVCLDDGKKFKSLKRHLRTTYNMTPDQYRAKWGLAPTYPMVAPNYAAARSELAKSMGLGARRKKSRETEAVAKAAPEQPKASGRGRRKKAA